MAYYDSIDTAVTRGLCPTFSTAALTTSGEPPNIDMNVALEEHERYNAVLRRLLPNITELPADDRCPDCCFIEDTAVIVPGAGGAGPLAVITRPGAESRQPEVPPVKEALLKFFRAHDIVEITAPGTLDGGDVLYTGHSLWVGLSKRSNQEAVNQLRSHLKIPVVAVPMPGDGHTLHLKSVVTLIHDGIYLLADNDSGLIVQRGILAALEGSQQPIPTFIKVSSNLAANVLRIGRHVVCQSPEEPGIKEVAEQYGLKLEPLAMTQSAKADGALTCCSLLFSAPKYDS